MLARHLASCGFALKQQLQVAHMDHAALRAAITDYFRTQLGEAKARRASLGPYTTEQREQVQNNVALLEEGNGEYWRLVGRDCAEQELGRFFDVSGLSRDEYPLDALQLGQVNVSG